MVDLVDAQDRIEARNAALAQSRFDDVNLAGTRFENVNLSGAIFNDVNLSRVAITDACLDGMTIRGVKVTDLFQAYDKVKADDG